MKALLSKIWAKLSAFAKAHPVWAVEIGVLLLVFGMGVLAGYKLFHKPPNVEYKEKLVEDVVSKQQLQIATQHLAELQQQIDSDNQTITDLKTHKTVVIVEKKTKEGDDTKTTTITTDTDKKTDSKTDTKTDTDTKVTDNTKTDKVDESTIHLTDDKSKTITQQGSSPFSATASFGYMWDFSNPGAKGSMYTGLNVGYNVIWIFGVEAWVFDPINNPTKPAVGGGVYLDFAKLFGVK